MKLVTLIIVLLILLGSCKPIENGWSEVPTPSDRTAVFPYLNIGNNGLLLSWVETVQDSIDILKIAKGDSMGFYEVTEVARGSDWFINWADFPKVSQFSDGRYITHWLQKSSASTYDYNIHIAIGEFGAKTPDTTFILHDDGVNAEHGFVSFLPLNKRMLVVWLDGRDTKKADGTYGHMTLRSAVVNTSGNKSKDQLIDSRVCDCCQTDLAMIAGKPVVVYRGRSEKEIRDNYYAIYNNGIWSKGKAIYNDGWMIPGCPVNGPAIVGTGKEGAAAWYTENNDIEKVKIAKINGENMEFSNPICEINNVLGRVDIKAKTGGGLLLTWMEKKTEKGLLNIKSFNSDARQGNTILVDYVDPSRASGFPHIVVLESDVYISYNSTSELNGIKIKKIGLSEL